MVVPDGTTARALNAALDLRACADDEKLWRPPAVLSWSAALREHFELSLLTEASAPAEFLLSPAQEEVLWEQVIDRDRDLAIEAAGRLAPLARQARQTEYLWALERAPRPAFESLDQSAYRRWGRAFAPALSALGAVDEAACLAYAANSGYAPAGGVVTRGFLFPEPRLAQWLGATPATGDAPRGDLAQVEPHVYTDAGDELRAALHWALGESLVDPRARVVVAVADLDGSREQVLREARRVGGSSERLFLGVSEPLLQLPALKALMLIVELEAEGPWHRASELIRHPCLAGAAAEFQQRALLDAKLRDDERYEWPLDALVNECRAHEQCPQLVAILHGLRELQGSVPKRQTLTAWLAHFDACLRLAGWPGEETPGAAQARRHWADLCDELGRLDAVLPAVSRTEALRRLRAALSSRGHSDSAPTCGVFVVSPATALALQPTHLWLTGCTSDAFVAGHHPTPFVPLATQNLAGVPGTEPNRDLWRARVLLESLCRDAVESHASWVQSEGELQVAPSPLLPRLRQARLASAIPTMWAGESLPCESLVDDRGPKIAAGSHVRGGAEALAAVARCPFQAFARFRLRADTVTDPLPGYSARQRGTIVHKALEALWQELSDSTRLAALDEAARRAALKRAFRQALRHADAETPLEQALFFLERQRLEDLLIPWLEKELEKAPFRVVDREPRYTVTLGPLSLGIGPDRIEERDDGKIRIVDYKTGQVSSTHWEVPRTEAPQLPLYALCLTQYQVASIAFAAVKFEKPGWTECPSQGKQGGQKDFAARLAEWEQDLLSLAGSFADGIASADPKHGRRTCARCDLQAFCRRLDDGASDDGGDEQESDD